MQQPKRSIDRRSKTVARNERLTALAGGVLLVLFVVDLFVTANLDKLIMIHIFIGALISGPLLVKLSSVGYRFFGYYVRRNPAFVAKGPPNVWLRLLGPFLILLTLLLVASGFGLALEGPANDRVWFLIHAASSALWIPLVAIHVYAHIRQVPRAIGRDLRSDAVSGRVKRFRVTLLSLIAGAIAGLVLMPIAAPWHDVALPHGVPSPLSLGIVAAIIGVLIAIPVLRGARE